MAHIWHAYGNYDMRSFAFQDKDHVVWIVHGIAPSS